MAQTPQKLGVAIVGGGIGGLIAALCVRHFCGSEMTEMNVYEQAHEYKEIGAGITLSPNAVKVLRKTGHFDEIRAIASRNTEIFMRRYDNGAGLFSVKSTAAEFPMLLVHRAELLDVLVQAVKKTKAATLHTNKKCDHIKNDNAMFGGMVGYRSVCSVADLEDWWPLESYACVWNGRGKHFMTYPLNSDKMVNIGAFITADEDSIGDTAESWTLRGDRRNIENEFKDWDPTVRRVIKLFDKKPLKYVLYDREPCDQWVFWNGKIVLLGDAAHAMVPHQGAGAGQAIEDAYVLGNA